MDRDFKKEFVTVIAFLDGRGYIITKRGDGYVNNQSAVFPGGYREVGLANEYADYQEEAE